MPNDTTNRPHVVVLGAGFAGLNFCKKMPHGIARITLIDRTNHHLFQPLLYQVAMAGLSAPDVAEPTRSVFRRRSDITVLMDDVKSIDLTAREVHLCDTAIAYDYLVLALGGVTSYFGKNEWERNAPGLKTVDDALRIRAKILTSFEKAESTGDLDERRRLMTIVIVGGGPTGVELAGSMAELTNHVFKRDFRRIDTRSAQVILVDPGDRVLRAYPPELSAAAKRQLEELGVTLMLGERVVHVDDGSVSLSSGARLETRNILWSAGVAASPVASTLGIALAPGGRIPVEPDLSVKGHPEVFAVGDLASVLDDKGEPVPGVAPAAIQMGQHVAKVLRAEIKKTGEPRRPFRYRDKGSMATIGRNRAVAWMGKVKLTGFFAWLAWLFVHVLFLVSFRDKVSVILEWAYSYVTYRRGARIIFGPACATSPKPAEPAAARPDPTPHPTPGGNGPKPSPVTV